jgi:integrase
MKPGLYPDGAGLYLQVSEAGGKSWLFRYEVNAKDRQMGLGSLRDVTLQEARRAAANCRLLRQAGTDPIDARNNERAKVRLQAAHSVTFKVAAERHMDARAASWSNPKHRKQWAATLEAYAYPVLGSISVQAIDTPVVLRVIEPIWETKPETASRVRGRIEAILDGSKVRGERTGENPARWKGHLDHILPGRSKFRRVKHHTALAYPDLPAFMAGLREQPGMSPRALEFLILTIARTGEVIGAKWPEFNLDGGLWSVPAERMKAKREHRVPLSRRAVTILRAQRKVCEAVGETEYVFPSHRVGRTLSNMAMLVLLGRMKRQVTVHGFRSTFRDWAAEATAYPSEVAEAALAHTIENKTEAAYFRADLLEKRRRLMEEWARYCETPPSKGRIVPIRA